MTPQDFSFKLTVPNDPEGISVIAVVAGHAVGYARLEGDTGAAFVERARAAAAQAMSGSTGQQCLVVFAAADGQLTMTIGKESISQSLPA